MIGKSDVENRRRSGPCSSARLNPSSAVVATTRQWKSISWTRSRRILANGSSSSTTRMLRDPRVGLGGRRIARRIPVPIGTVTIGTARIDSGRTGKALRSRCAVRIPNRRPTRRGTESCLGALRRASSPRPTRARRRQRKSKCASPAGSLARRQLASQESCESREKSTGPRPVPPYLRCGDPVYLAKRLEDRVAAARPGCRSPCRTTANSILPSGRPADRRARSNRFSVNLRRWRADS